MFPTTIWDVVKEGGDSFAARYRPPVLAFVRRLGVRPSDAEDLCQEVFVRLLRGGVLEKADAARGPFRALLRTVALRTVQDWRRRRRDVPVAEIEPVAAEPDFDRAWALHLTERALARLAEESPAYHEVLKRHLDGASGDRNKLWIARKKLKALLRREIAFTCRSPEEIEEEMASLRPYLG